MHELYRYHLNKEHEMRNGHLSADDRANRIRYGFLNSEDKQYHSPERPQALEGEHR